MGAMSEVWEGTWCMSGGGGSGGATRAPGQLWLEGPRPGGGVGGTQGGPTHCREATVAVRVVTCSWRAVTKPSRRVTCARSALASRSQGGA